MKFINAKLLVFATSIAVLVTSRLLALGQPVVNDPIWRGLLRRIFPV